MHHSLLGAGRTTHLKIVALSLAAAIVVVLIGLNARVTDGAGTGAVVKAAQPPTFAGQETSPIR